MSALDNFKLAAYLDEAGDNPASSVDTLLRCNINYCVIRNNKISDNYASEIKRCFTKITPLCIVDDFQDFNRTFNLSVYLNVNFVAFKINCNDFRDFINNVDIVMNMSQKYCKKVLIETTSNMYLYDYNQLMSYVNGSKINILYDPAGFMLRRNFDHMKYWLSMCDNIVCVDISDVITNRCFKPPGFGNCNIKNMISNVCKNKWLFLEPNLVDKCKSNSFIRAFDAFCSLVEDI